MPSHLDKKPEQPLPAGVSQLDLEGNKLADNRAGAAASRLEVP